MPRILIVEDEIEKKRLLISAALEVQGLSLSDIDFVTDALEAKKLIRQRKYDLLILDINLPPRADQQTVPGGGLEVLSFIENNLQAKQPTYIVGMSSYDDGIKLASQAFSSPLRKLLTFSYTDHSWKDPLKEAVNYLIQHDQPPYHNDGVTYHIDLGVIVALDEELESVLQLDAAWTEIKVPHDDSQYFKGVLVAGSAKLGVVAVVAPKMGMPTAAVVASKLIHNFRPRYLAMTGICAGVRGKTDIGDILVADPCFDWGSGKWIKLKDGELKFRPAPYPWRLDESLRAGAKKVADINGLLDQMHDKFNGDKPPNKPKVIVEAMASGGSVLQASQLMDDVREQHKNLIGVEMETYAVFCAAEYAAVPRPLCISIKSVTDFGDDDKSDDFHLYAAYTSAQFLYHFATNVLMPDDY